MQVTCAGFEVETLINVRVARAGLSVAEVPSAEHERLHGQGNLNVVRDGLRILRTILTERLREDVPAADPDAWRPAFCELCAAPDGEDRPAAQTLAAAGARQSAP
jgi:hypothetical protein